MEKKRPKEWGSIAIEVWRPPAKDHMTSRPPINMAKTMATKIVHQWRGKGHQEPQHSYWYQSYQDQTRDHAQRRLEAKLSSQIAHPLRLRSHSPKKSHRRPNGTVKVDLVRPTQDMFRSTKGQKGQNHTPKLKRPPPTKPARVTTTKAVKSIHNGRSHWHVISCIAVKC